MTTLDIQRLLIIFFESAAMLVGFFCFKKYKGTIMNRLTIYLFVIVVCEITGNRLNYYGLKMQANHVFTYFAIPMEFLFFYHFFYVLNESKKMKAFILIAACVSLATLLFEEAVLKQTGKYFFMSLFYSVSNLLLLVMLIAFFVKLLRSKTIIDFKNNPAFWISTGLLLFYLGTFPLFSMYNSLWDLDKAIFRKYYTVQFILNYTMYTLFVIAFIWGKPKFIHSL